MEDFKITGVFFGPKLAINKLKNNKYLPQYVWKTK